MVEREKPKPPTDDQYKAAAIRLAFDFAPSIRACRECRWPVASGYCCSHCGSVNP
jgi:hypothetical protein